MGLRVPTLWGVTAAVLLSACGGSSHKLSTSSNAGTAATQNHPATGIRGHVLAGNELRGFQVAGLLVDTSPTKWVADEQLPPAQWNSATASLRREGFRSGAREDLASGNVDGLALVEQLSSASAARTELTTQVSETKATQTAADAYHSFSVPQVPGAVGFTLGSPGNSGVNIAFSDGSYFYLIGEAAGDPSAKASLIATAQHLYHRVHG
jgi:hypothetical protein